MFGARKKPVTNENKPVFKIKLKMPFLADGTFRVGPQNSVTNDNANFLAGRQARQCRQSSDPGGPSQFLVDPVDCHVHLAYVRPYIHVQ